MTARKQKRITRSPDPLSAKTLERLRDIKLVDPVFVRNFSRMVKHIHQFLEGIGRFKKRGRSRG